MELEEVWRRIDQRYDRLSAQLQRAARFIRENPEDVALESLRSLAARAGVSPAAMTRLTQALGIDNWDELQTRHRNWLTRDRHGVFSERADRLLNAFGEPGGADVLDAIGQAEIANIDAVFRPSVRASLTRAADCLAAVQSITVFGIRSCFSVAFFLYYSLSLFLPGTRLATGTGGALLEELDHLGPKDLFIVISVDPYSREALAATVRAKEAGARMIAITDSSLAPIAASAEVTLVASNHSPSHIASPIGLIAVCQALTALVLARAGDDALAALRQREAALAARSAYLSSGQSK